MQMKIEFQIIDTQMFFLTCQSASEFRADVREQFGESETIFCRTAYRDAAQLYLPEATYRYTKLRTDCSVQLQLKRVTATVVAALLAWAFAWASLYVLDKLHFRPRRIWRPDAHCPSAL